MSRARRVAPEATGSGTGNGTGSKTGTGSGTGAEIEPGTGTGAEPGTGTGAEPEERAQTGVPQVAETYSIRRPIVTGYHWLLVVLQAVTLPPVSVPHPL